MRGDVLSIVEDEVATGHPSKPCCRCNNGFKKYWGIFFAGNKPISYRNFITEKKVLCQNFFDDSPNNLSFGIEIEQMINVFLIKPTHCTHGLVAQIHGI